MSSIWTPGVTPWPRLAIHALQGLSSPPLKDAHMRLTASSMASFPPYNAVGSRFPCKAIVLEGDAALTISRATLPSMVQSRPMTS